MLAGAAMALSSVSVVANALLPAIRDVLGDAATDEVLGAWGEAYWALADILIGKEEVLYAEVDGN